VRALVLLVCGWLLVALPVRAAEVTVEHEGFDLVGNLALVEGKSLKSDGVVLILHDRLGDFAAEPVAGLQSRLAANGINSLAINLSLGRDHRNAAFTCAGELDQRFEDALPELHAWVKYLEEQGATDISLAGFGLGASQVALYASKTTQQQVRRVLLISPVTWSFEAASADYLQRFKVALPELLADVEDKIANDDGGTLLEGVGFLDCDKAQVTARSFASYYRDKPYFSTPALLPQVPQATLVVAAESDDVSPDLMAKMQEVPARDNLKFDVIDGADRRFSGPAADQLVSRLKLFIDETRGK
jgi:pimeloyl-ACP methyl ester carboxylesterase